jgi:Zinc carboxypeptidase
MMQKPKPCRPAQFAAHRWLWVLFLGAGMLFQAHAISQGSLAAAKAVSEQSRARLAADLEAQAGSDTGAAFQWGYSYARLLQDLELWRKSPYVQIDSIGASVQGRAIWKVTITEGDVEAKSRIYMHARTHPSEVQASHVAIAGMNFLMDTTSEAQALRRKYFFHFIPMYNPDGVELGFPRQNANSIDLESNWNVEKPEAEVLVLRADFEKHMQKDSSRIGVALNLHSDRFNCTRFFFYHDSVGTSPFYAQLEKTFIGDVQSEFPEGIEAWSFVQSWRDKTHTEYPEGWWWTEYQDSVMALTYEDANCPDASSFDRTGRALIVGSAKYLDRNHVGVRLARQGHWNGRVGWAMRDRSQAVFRMNAQSFSLLGVRLPHHQSPD